MAEEYVEEEYEDIRDRQRGAGITSLMSKISGREFFFILISGALLIYLYSTEAEQTYIWITGFAFVGLIVYFVFGKQEQQYFIREPTARKIALNNLENKKDNYDIPTSAEIKTTYARLEKTGFGEILEWHVGAEWEDRNGKRDKLRVDIHPFTGNVTGVVKVDTSFKGSEIPDKVFVRPEGEI